MAKEALAEMNGGFTELWSALWPIVAATAVMAAVVLLLREFAFARSSESPVVRLVLFSLGGAITYVAVLFAIGSPVIAEGTEVVGWILRRQRQ